jgi:uncharacterized protein (DUF736 family)
MNIGTIRANDRGALTGSIATLTVAMSFALRGVASNHPNAPRYEICTRSPAGAAVQIGALWEQTSKTTGECFLQGRIDDPSMARPLAISAFARATAATTSPGCAPSAAPAFAWRPRPTTIPLIWTRPDGLAAMPRVMFARGTTSACGAWRHADAGLARLRRRGAGRPPGGEELRGMRMGVWGQGAKDANQPSAPRTQEGVGPEENTAMNIGELKLNGAGVYMGKIQTATLDLVVGLRPVNSSNAAAPKYDVMVRAKNGQFIPVGGLWEKTANNGGGTFLQGQIDDPSFEAPLSIALFAQADGALNIAWSRPRRRAEAGFADDRDGRGQRWLWRW